MVGSSCGLVLDRGEHGKNGMVLFNLTLGTYRVDRSFDFNGMVRSGCTMVPRGIPAKSSRLVSSPFFVTPRRVKLPALKDFPSLFSSSFSILLSTFLNGSCEFILVNTLRLLRCSDFSLFNHFLPVYASSSVAISVPSLRPFFVVFRVHSHKNSASHC
jgi:hypothetical protein